MTWDSHEPSNQAKPSASHPQGWEGPGWWDEWHAGAQDGVRGSLRSGRPVGPRHRHHAADLERFGQRLQRVGQPRFERVGRDR